MTDRVDEVPVWNSPSTQAYCTFIPSRMVFVVTVHKGSKIFKEELQTLFDPREFLDEDEIEVTYQAAEVLLNKD